MSVKRIIYQIGRFESSIDEKVNFEIEINDKPYSCELSSFALKKYFGESTKVILVYPVSILLNEKALKGIENKLNKNLAGERKDEEDLKSFYEKIEGIVKKPGEKEKYIKKIPGNI